MQRGFWLLAVLLVVNKAAAASHSAKPVAQDPALNKKQRPGQVHRALRARLRPECTRRLHGVCRKQACRGIALQCSCECSMQHAGAAWDATCHLLVLERHMSLHEAAAANWLVQEWDAAVTVLPHSLMPHIAQAATALTAARGACAFLHSSTCSYTYFLTH